ncbi:MAG: UvrD-helicase domain-containing protein, partial [Lachnospiraceae bacterium]|nr:UvrD-helicase domain-containing protein [Lachnospiraceae bacterium]
MSEMTSLERDTQSRNRIVSEINTNFFVEAGAGSGKTTMLVSRMVAMVEAGIPIGKICAITFTKAAAGEFYDRFQKLLIERSNPAYVWEDKGYAGQLPKPTDETRERCAEALNNIDLCFMGTIDSFCSMVLSEHPSEARIPSDASIVSDQDAEIFYKQQYVKICAGEYGSDLTDLANTFRALYRNAEDVFVQGESVFMNNRNVHFNYTKPTAVDIDKTFASEREELVKAVKCLVDHPELKYPTEQKNLAAWEKIEDIYKNLRRKWSNNFSNVVYALKSLKDLRTIPEALNHHEFELAGVFEPGGKQGKWLECSACGESGLLSKLQNLQYSASMAFLEACMPVLESAMRDKGNMTFFDYLYYLRNMLRRDAEGDGKLIRYIYDRHSYFLIDEFQDTNPLQAEVFFYLSSEHPVPQWSACEPRPGSLFIVGDPKQSIYRFRSADVTSFLKVKGLFEQNGGSILSLSRNFRSTSTLCEYFNRMFTVMLPEETRDQSKF